RRRRRATRACRRASGTPSLHLERPSHPRQAQQYCADSPPSGWASSSLPWLGVGDGNDTLIGPPGTLGRQGYVHAVGVDIGGTKIAVGVVDEFGTILAKTKRKTDPADPASIDAAIADAVGELAADHEFHAVGLAAAGFVSSDRKRVLFAPNISWR